MLNTLKLLVIITMGFINTCFSIDIEEAKVLVEKRFEYLNGERIKSFKFNEMSSVFEPNRMAFFKGEVTDISMQYPMNLLSIITNVSDDIGDIVDYLFNKTEGHESEQFIAMFTVDGERWKCSVRYVSTFGHQNRESNRAVMNFGNCSRRVIDLRKKQRIVSRERDPIKKEILRKNLGLDYKADVRPF